MVKNNRQDSEKTRAKGLKQLFQNPMKLGLPCRIAS
jgi:hypothetical protein